jgi:hypothetical protein
MGTVRCVTSLFWKEYVSFSLKRRRVFRAPRAPEFFRSRLLYNGLRVVG